MNRRTRREIERDEFQKAVIQSFYRREEETEVETAEDRLVFYGDLCCELIGFLRDTKGIARSAGSCKFEGDQEGDVQWKQWVKALTDEIVAFSRAVEEQQHICNRLLMYCRNQVGFATDNLLRVETQDPDRIFGPLQEGDD